MTLGLILTGFIVLLSIRLPIAFAFLFINIIGIYIFWDGSGKQLVLSIYNSVSVFSLVPVPLFVLMGELMFQSGIASRMIEALDKFMGSLPGRLSLLAVAGGSLFSVLSGSSLSSVAMLGSSLVPEMEKYGYNKQMIFGPILGSGGLAMMIPPSALGVLLASLASISIGGFLIAIIIPGILMASLYALYIIVTCLLNPLLAPSYRTLKVSSKDKLLALIKYVLPLGLIIVSVIGFIFFGITTPTESSAIGALMCLVLSILYNGFKWEMIKKALIGTIRITVMMFMILTGSMAFAQLLAYSGATTGLMQFAINLPLNPLLIVLAMLLVVIMLGTLMEGLSIIMIVLPIYLPIIQSFGFSSIWFAVLILICIEIGGTSPPFGLSLFVMKSVAPADTKMVDIYKAAIPYIMCDAIVVVLVLLVPSIALWLPQFIR